jgi:hypothetical protein
MKEGLEGVRGREMKGGVMFTEKIGGEYGRGDRAWSLRGMGKKT